MEAIFLDNAFKVTRIVDAYSSFIWRDQYIGYGDFELRFPMVDGALGGIELGRYLTNNISDRYMIVEGIEMVTSVEEGNTVTITGRSLESLLDRRIVIDQVILTGPIQDCIFRLISANVLNPVDPMRKISKFWFRYSTDKTILNTTIDASVEKGKNLFSAIYDICYEKHIGFRCLPIDEDGTIAIELYSGENRSYDQTKNPWVVFSPKFENIQATDMSIQTENLRNVMYAESEYSERVENADGTYEDVDKVIEVQINSDQYSGLERRELFASSGETPQRIDKSDFGEPEDRVNFYQYAQYRMVEFHEREFENDSEQYRRWAGSGMAEYPENPWDPRNSYLPPRYSDYEEWDWVIVDEVGYNAALEQAARQIQAEYEAAMANEAAMTEELIRQAAEQELAEWMRISEFDGEVAPKFQYILGEHYQIGDVVQVINEYGFQAKTRVVGVLYSEEAGTGFMTRPQFESDDKAVFEI